MTVDPFQRFLGLPANADPLTLLGLRAASLDRVRIETAMQERLEQVYRHPDGRSEEAERVRRRLRESAAVLFERVRLGAAAHQASHAPGAGVSRLTEFDRSVLAVLVGCGGWNSRSRAQLVALSGAFGVSAPGLMRVVGALSEYARTGGRRLGAAELTAGAARVAAPPSAVPVAGVSTSPLLARDLSDGKGDGVWTTIKLSAIFGLLTIILGVVTIRAFLPEKPDGSAEEPVRAHREGPVLPGRAPAPREGATEEPAPRIVPFRPLPSFTGNAAPIAAIDAADECPQLPQHFESNARKLAITDDPSEEVFRSWEISIELIATGWVRVDESTRVAIAGAIGDVLDETTDAPSVSDRLLAALLPSSGRMRDPADLWRGAWRAGTLGAIAADARLPAAVVQRARSQLSFALGEEEMRAAFDFDTAAGLWLDQKLDGMVERLEYDDQAYDYWEMWIAARQRLGDEDGFNAALMTAVQRILATSTDLVRPGRSVNVLGRLVSLADFQTSAVVKERFGDLFDDQSITDRDLWVLTSLLAHPDTAPWFGEELVLPDQAGVLFRRRMRDSIARHWPEVPAEEAAAFVAHGRGIPVDARAAGRWLSLSERLPATPEAGDAEQLTARLVLACRLNEAAALLAAHKTSEAEALMQEIEDSLPAAAADGDDDDGDSFGSPGRSLPTLQPPRRPSNQPRISAPGAGVGSPRSGQAIGRDGEWAQAYADARRKTEEKLRWLRVLRTTAGTDLGPIDAEAFVREVYRGSPQDARSLARAILVEQFSTGPNVAMELLDQFPDAPRNDDISRTLSRLTGRVLPSLRSEAWPVEARLSVVEHALSLRRLGESPIDQLAELLTESLAGRLALLRHEEAARAAVRTPQMAAELLAEAWRDRAAASMASEPAPADLPDLGRRRDTRRRLATGPIQLLVADLLTVLDYLTYVTVAEQPALHGAAMSVHQSSAERRQGATHVLQQAIEVERAVAQIWTLRMALKSETQAQREADE